MLVGMVFSPVILSLGTILTVTIVITGSHATLNDYWRWSLRKALRSSLFWGMAGLYLIMFYNMGLTEDWDYFLGRLRIKVPLLLLSLSLTGLSTERSVGWLDRRVRLWLTGGMALVLAGILVNYALNFADINDMIRRGQPMPVPRGNHIRFSLLVAIASVIGVDGWLRYRDRWLLLMGIFLFVALHLLAVRSGLATAYLGLLVLATWWALRRGNFRLLLGVVAGLTILPVVAYLAVPSFRTKMQYMRYELLHRDVQQDRGQYSDAGRFTSIRLGLEVWREHPLIGVGYGNVSQAMERRFAETLPGLPAMRPHNQFVSALVGGGVIGLAITLACFLAIGFGGGRWRDPLFFALWAMLLASCLVENTLETSVGVTLFTLTLLLFAYPPWRKPG